jgi:hypothetical protein
LGSNVDADGKKLAADYTLRDDVEKDGERWFMGSHE